MIMITRRSMLGLLSCLPFLKINTEQTITSKIFDSGKFKEMLLVNEVYWPFEEKSPIVTTITIDYEKGQEVWTCINCDVAQIRNKVQLQDFITNGILKQDKFGYTKTWLGNKFKLVSFTQET